ncbi:hypothetical protein LBMAG42_57470 [Deltaproteobacteria bacterium]|nr:hypothetical protein LBMAG42_57470 [Deltaproteobacteria bacterium]
MNVFLAAAAFLGLSAGAPAMPTPETIAATGAGKNRQHNAGRERAEPADLPPKTARRRERLKARAAAAKG